MKLRGRLDCNESHVCVLCCIFFFWSAAAGNSGYCSQTVAALFLLFRHFYHISPWIPQHCLWSHKYHFSATFIKTGSHSTIHTFKNYFVKMFSVLAKIISIQTELYLIRKPYTCHAQIAQSK